MKVLVLFAHPVETSYQAALHQVVVKTLKAKGHGVDDCDLYAEGFNPLLTREERLNYHDLSCNQEPVASHVERLRSAEALIIVTPVWNFGYPAILKGYLDRVFLPGVSFDIADGKIDGKLDNVRKFTTITTYGARRLMAMLAGDPPRKLAKRVLPAVMPSLPQAHYLAHYNMNRSTDETRRVFIAKVKRHMEQF